MQTSNWKTKVPETFERIEPLVEAMMAKFPPEMNIQGFDPALTEGIAEIVAQENEQVQKESIERAIEVVEKQRKTGVHEFDLGYRVCRWCGEQKTGVYTVRKNLIVDEKSGGSLVEATDYAYDITGQPCEKNTEPKVNKAIDDILSTLKTLLH